MIFRDSMFKIFAKIKFLYDIGGMFITMGNFALLVLANSEKLQTILGIKNTWIVAFLPIIAIPIALLCIIMFGFFLLKIGFYKEYRQQASGRDPVVNETLAIVRRLEDKIDKKPSAEKLD